MSSSRTRLWVVLFLIVLVVVAFLWTFPALSAGPAGGLAYFSAYWDFACVSALIPIATYFQAGWNRRADRAINPFSKRFIPTVTAVSVAVILIAIWLILGFLVVVPAISAYFYTMALGNGDAPTVSLLLQVGLAIFLPLLCTAAASPAGLARTFLSPRR